MSRRRPPDIRGIAAGIAADCARAAFVRGDHDRCEAWLDAYDSTIASLAETDEAEAARWADASWGAPTW